jgi:hypothetical protein
MAQSQVGFNEQPRNVALDSMVSRRSLQAAQTDASERLAARLPFASLSSVAGNLVGASLNSRAIGPPVIGYAEQRWVMVMAGLVALLTWLPFAVSGFAARDAGMVFSGFLLNPVDGFTYLAKMRMGWQGHWLYHLPFTLEQGPGALLFTLYFALGHLARALDVPLVDVFHAARIGCNFVFLWVVYGFVARATGDVQLRRLMWWLVAVGSGLAWVVQKYGLGLSFYEQQAIWHMNMFYIMFIAPHLPLAAALMLLMVALALNPAAASWRVAAPLLACSLSLVLVLPYSLVLVYVVLGVTLVAIGWRDRALPWDRSIVLVLSGLATLPVLLYLQWSIRNDPTLVAYTRQNEAWSPSGAGMLLSFGLLLPFLVPGALTAWRRRSDWDIMLLAWIATALVLMYLPYQYQWRFSAGLHVPIAVLAAQGLRDTVRRAWVRRGVIALVCLTPCYLMLTLIAGKGSVQTAIAHYPLTYLSRQEATTLRWMAQNLPPRVAVLASHEMGLFIPAYAGQRVVYGHVSETIDPKTKSRLLDDFFSGSADQRAGLLQALGVDYVLIGPRERARARDTLDPAQLPLTKVFSDGDVAVYQVTR